jgi:hypothetical protein
MASAGEEKRRSRSSLLTNVRLKHCPNGMYLNSIYMCYVRAKFPNATSFSEVFFIDASTTRTIETDLKNIALEKRVGETANDTIIWLAGQRKDWLLLFNNADNIVVNLNKYFPSCSHGNILITSRNHETCIYAPGFNYKVAGLDPKDARNLLLRIANQAITNETCNLAESLTKVYTCQQY